MLDGKFVGLAYYLSKVFVTRRGIGWLLDEAFSAALLTMVEVLPSYKEDVASLNTFLSMKIRYGLRDWYRNEAPLHIMGVRISRAEVKNHRVRSTVLVISEEPEDPSAGERGHLPTVESNQERVDSILDGRETLDSLLRELPRRDRRAMLMIYGGFSFQEVGLLLDLDISRVSQIHKQSLQRMWRKAKELGLTDSNGPTTRTWRVSNR